MKSKYAVELRERSYIWYSKQIFRREEKREEKNLNSVQQVGIWE